jgi:uncharacterized protein
MPGIGETWHMGGVDVVTPEGPGELVLAQADTPRAVLLLGHGAGGDVDGWDLALLASALPASGISVLRYRQPHRVAGRKLPGSTASLDRGWAPALAAARELGAGVPLFTGGHSAGARTACRGFGADQAGVVCLSFPLHPPGRPQKSRASELAGVSGPVLVLQGSADAFGTPAEVLRALRDAGRIGVRLEEVPGANHSLAPARNLSAMRVYEREQIVVGAVSSFVNDVLRR